LTGESFFMNVFIRQRLAFLLALAAVGACTAGALRLGAPEWSAQKGSIAAAIVEDSAASAPGDSVIAAPVAEARDSIAPGDSAIAAPGAEAPDFVAHGDSAIAAPAVAEALDSIAPGDSVIAAPAVAEAPDSIAPGDSAIAAPVAEAPDSIAPGDSAIVAPVAEAPDSVAPAPAPDGAVVIAEPAGKMPTAPRAPRAKPTKAKVWGMGLHWGVDFSMGMKDGKDSADIPGGGFKLGSFPDLFDSLRLAYLDSLGVSTVIDDAPYLKISRSAYERTAINFGGKLFVDAVPLIETVEFSFNLGVWQYDCSASYLDVDSINDNPERLLDGDLPLPYKDVPISLEAHGMSYFGLYATPYAKLQFDVSARKTVLKLWRVRFSAGAGMSAHFATPLLNSGLIDGVRADRGIESPEELVAEFMDPSGGMGEAIVQKILDEIFTPRFGAHIVAGAHLKLSAVGAYIDGKFLIPISKYDENNQLKNSGFLVNAGVSLSF
jgi:hypothetical protein